MRLRRSGIIALVAAFAIAAPASARPPSHGPAGDIPDFTIDGACPFPVLVHTPVNRERATTLYDAGGNPVKTIITGALFATLTNLDSGSWVDLNVSGPLVIDEIDGSMAFTGHSLGWFDGTPGLRLYEGRYDAEGNGTGTTVDICALLAG
jgi:hypothetical protein